MDLRTHGWRYVLKRERREEPAVVCVYRRALVEYPRELDARADLRIPVAEIRREQRELVVAQAVIQAIRSGHLPSVLHVRPLGMGDVGSIIDYFRGRRRTGVE